MAEISHRYSVTVCPQCGADLTTELGVLIVCQIGATDTYTGSQLDHSGRLIDVNDLVANGYDNDLWCNDCGHSLTAYEIEEDGDGREAPLP